PIRKEDDPITQSHCDLALAIQIVTEECMIALVQLAKNITASKNLCLAGGVALNCVSNGKILSSGIFENVFVPSSPGDSGAALGAAWLGYHQHYLQPRDFNHLNSNAYLG